MPKKLARTNTNQGVASIAMLLTKEQISDLQIPYNNYLDPKILDYSLISLKQIEQYLKKIRKKLKTLTGEQYSIVLLRCGTYCGEVIRKRSINYFKWITYEEALAAVEQITALNPSLTTAFVLIDRKKNLTFPIAKVEKFLHYGESESLHFYASVITNLDKLK